MHQQVPGQVDAVLLSHTLVFVQRSDMSLLLDELSVGDSGMIDVMDQGTLRRSTGLAVFATNRRQLTLKHSLTNTTANWVRGSDVMPYV